MRCPKLKNILSYVDCLIARRVIIDDNSAVGIAVRHDSHITLIAGFIQPLLLAKGTTGKLRDEAAQRPRVASATTTLGLTNIGQSPPDAAFPLGMRS